MTKLTRLTACVFAVFSMSGTFLVAQTNHGTSHSAVMPPLANDISADTLVYVGWSGMDAIRTQVQQSSLADLLTNAQTACIVRDVLPFVLNYVNSENPRMASQMKGLWKIALGLRDYPTGFYFEGMARQKDGLPFPRLGFVSRVGDNADVVVSQLSFIDQLGRDLNLPIRVHSSDGIVRVSLGGSLSLKSALAEQPEFKSLIACQKNVPAVWAYVNVARLPEVVEQSALALPRLAHATAGRWKAWKHSLALEQVGGLLWSAGFENGQWVTRGKVSAPAPRQGLAGILDSRPIVAELLRTVPATASVVGAFQIRPDVGLPALEGLLKRMDSSAAKRLDDGNRLAQSVLGADPRARLTQSLGRQWAYYCDNNIGGRSLDGLVLVNALQDASGFRTWLPSVMALLKPDPASTNNGVRIRQLDSDGLTVWRIESSGAGFVLAICGNYLLASRRIETVIAACGSIRQAGPSILDQDEFQAMRKRLGAETAGAFWYADLCQNTFLPQLAWAAFDEFYRTRGSHGFFQHARARVALETNIQVLRARWCFRDN